MTGGEWKMRRKVGKREMTQRQDVTEVVLSVLICRYVQDG